MHSFREHRSETLGTRSSSVGNIQNEYTRVPKWFYKMVFRVPRSRSSLPMFRELASKRRTAADTSSGELYQVMPHSMTKRGGTRGFLNIPRSSEGDQSQQGGDNLEDRRRC
jgi:hypothetical protein